MQYILTNPNDFIRSARIVFIAGKWHAQVTTKYGHKCGYYDHPTNAKIAIGKNIRAGNKWRVEWESVSPKKKGEG